MGQSWVNFPSTFLTRRNRKSMWKVKQAYGNIFFYTVETMIYKILRLSKILAK